MQQEFLDMRVSWDSKHFNCGFLKNTWSHILALAYACRNNDSFSGSSQEAKMPCLWLELLKGSINAATSDHIQSKEKALWRSTYIREAKLSEHRLPKLLVTWHPGQTQSKSQPIQPRDKWKVLQTCTFAPSTSVLALTFGPSLCQTAAADRAASSFSK